ncbi:MAG: endonuclease I family protein [Bacteriovoracaceae bacterium]
MLTITIKSVLTLALVLFYSLAHAASEHNYYPSEIIQKVLSGELESDAAKAMIHEILDSAHEIDSEGNHTLTRGCHTQDSRKCIKQKSLGYKTARRILFGDLDLKRDGKGYFVKDVYCEEVFRASTKKIGSFGPQLIPNSNVVNCEHTWPQSRFTSRYSRSMQKGDLHHLFPTKSVANSTRGNHPFGEIDARTNSRPCASAKLGTYSSEMTNYYFEPPMKHRGNVARALFYFAVRYDLPIDSVQEAFLRKWHEEDPVDQEEFDRNNKIQKIQNNRNPFIDYPRLVNVIKNI